MGQASKHAFFHSSTFWTLERRVLQAQAAFPSEYGSQLCKILYKRSRGKAIRREVSLSSSSSASSTLLRFSRRPYKANQGLLRCR